MWIILKKITSIHNSITFNENVARERRYPIVGKRNIFPLEGKFLNEKIIYSALLPMSLLPMFFETKK